MPNYHKLQNCILKSLFNFYAVLDREKLLNIFPNTARGDRNWQKYMSFSMEDEQTETNTDFLKTLLEAKVEFKENNESITEQPGIIVLTRKELPDEIEPTFIGTNIYDLKHPAKYLGIIRLPCDLPDINIVGQNILFARYDAIHLFDILTRQKTQFNDHLLLGNSGIGKFMLQYIMLVFLARPDIYALAKEKLLPSQGEEGQLLPPQQVQVTRRISIVIRWVGNESITVFYLEKGVAHTFSASRAKEIMVIFKKHSAETLLLYEPLVQIALTLDPLTKLHFVITSSPNSEIYKEYLKTATSRYMPCPSKGELYAMGEVLKDSVEDYMKQYYTKDKIKERIERFGPYLRYAFPRKVNQMDNFKLFQNKAIGDEENLISIMKFQEIDRKTAPSNHWLLRYLVFRNIEAKQEDMAYLNCTIVLASPYIETKLIEKLENTSLSELAEHLKHFIDGSNDMFINSLAPRLFESLFTKYAISTDGLKSKFANMIYGKKGKDVTLDNEWKLFELKKAKIDQSHH